MAKPVEKSAELEQFLEKCFGRTTAITTDICVCCGKDATKFKDELSLKEYSISGLCQECQDMVFGHQWDDEED